MNYLMESNPTFGPYAWGFYLLQALLLVIGFYLYFLRKDVHAIRKRLLAKVGLILLAMGSMGTLFGVLRMQNVGGFAHRYWFYLLLALDVLIGIVLFFYVRRGLTAISTSPRSSSARARKRSASRTAKPSSPRVATADQNQTESDGERIPQRSRREARRERKRKNR